MNAPLRHENRKNTGPDQRPNSVPRGGSARALLPALIALGGGSLLAAGPAAALQLGEMRVQSNLGQPLRASIAYALNPGEHIRGHCIRLENGGTASGLPVIHQARVSVRENVIRLTGRAALNDPLVALTLNIDCPGTANMSREYTAFIDPAVSAGPAARDAAASGSLERRTRVARDAAAAADTARVPSPARRPVAAGTYRVQPGDSLSDIAARITGRRLGLWDTVDVLFAANPEAFVSGNRNLLLAGSELVIPRAVLEPGTRAAVPARTAQASPSAANATSLQAAPVQPAPAAEAAGGTSTAAGTQTPGQSASVEQATATPAAKPRQGDISPGADGPFVSPVAPEAVSSAAQAGATSPLPAAAQAPPAAKGPAFSTNGNAGGSRAWLMWLGGSGAALILALLLFGRQLKARFGSAAPSRYGRRLADADDTTVIARADLDASSLDVDLDDAGGPGDSGDIDLAQEFGYTMPGHASAEDRFGSTAILESEILPSDETGEYDLSMIVDATKHTLPDAGDTTKDLRAIQVDERDGDEASDGEYTLSRDVDHSILEQDYEDELTATQALGEELARAAREMSLEIEVGDAASPLPTADDDTVDATAAMPAGVDVENASAPTVDMPRAGSPDEAPSDAEDEREETRVGEGLTSTMADAENDPTAQTDETKKLRAS